MLEDTELSHYRITRLLGRGGMGEVYLARDLILDRDVAIKLLPAAQVADRDARRRFVREAQAAARLDHPHICHVFEVAETTDGRAYIVMAYVEGETLAARLSRGPLPPREALSLVRDIADALGVAHAAGIVHRDLKPQNVMLTTSGRPKLLDFGVAKLLPGGAAKAAAITTSGSTAPGSVVGTPAYMSPEQVEGGEIDGRSDLFALGSMLFECIAGRRAFEGSSVLSVAGAIVHVHPPFISTVRPDSPPEIDLFCARLLAKDPVDRFQTAGEVLGALRLLLPATHKTTAFDPAVPHRRAIISTRRTAALALVAFAALAIGVPWGYRLSSGLPTPPADAARWYQRGTDYIREGAFHSATAALEQAIAQFPQYPLAYARHAEALAELDDQTRAGESLLRMQDILGDESRLSVADRLRLRGIRALVLRDIPRALEAYRQLVIESEADAGAWIDLGRAYEAAETQVDAAAAYTRALAIDADLPAAHVRLAYLAAQSGRRDAALASFSNAERLYRSASNVEGETEVLLRRGMFLDARGEFDAAMRDLDRARDLAVSSRAWAHSVRIRLAIGSVSASRGALSEAEAMTLAAISDARSRALGSLVADGLIDLAGLLVDQSSRWSEADAHVQEAVRLAAERGAQRTAARATLQRASLALQRDAHEDARQLATSTIDFLKSHGYRRFELTAMTILGRAQRGLDDLTAARASANAVIDAAESLGDEAQLALAFASLSSVSSDAGDLPGALEARLQAERINRKLGDVEALPFDLTNRAELLIRLGRLDEAIVVIRELGEGLAAKSEAFEGRRRRIDYVRALSAVTFRDYQGTVRFAGSVLAASRAQDATALQAHMLLAYARARLAMPPRATQLSGDAPALTPALVREGSYWVAAEALARNSFSQARSALASGMASAQHAGNHELAWRLAALGAAAARSLGEHSEADRYESMIVSARASLSAAWGEAFTRYSTRPDLVELFAAATVDAAGTLK